MDNLCSYFFILMIVILSFILFKVIISLYSGIDKITFDTLNDYECSPWSIYIRDVYGDNPTIFPCVFDPIILYTKSLKKANININLINRLFSSWCPKIKNTLYFNMSATHDPPDCLWRWIPPPFEALPSHTKQEVIHSVDDYIFEENDSYWMYYARGSGIFINMGNTISFSKHEDAVKFFLNETCNLKVDVSCCAYFNRIAHTARLQGYDTIQYLSHDDMRCGNSTIEIVDVRNSGNQTCKNEIFTGWNASNPCICDSKLKYINCQKK